MVRAPCCEKMGLKKGPWTPEEDQILISYIQKHGHGNWRALPKQAGLLRCGKSCRLRWTNYLRPDIKRGNFTKEEEDTIIKLHEMLGNRWSTIAARLPGRTDNEIKNVWHTHLKKKLKNYHQPPQATKRHSSTVPKCDAKVAKATSEPIASNSTIQENGNISKDAPASPQESSSDITSVTNSSSLNMDSNGVEIEHEEMNSSEYFPEIDESFWSEQSSSEMSSSATETSAMNTLSNDLMVIKNEEMDSSMYIRRIDESFWSQELPTDDSNTQSNFPGITGEPKFEFPSSSSISTTMECDNVCISNTEDDMDFWFNVFIRAEDLPELPEF